MRRRAEAARRKRIDHVFVKADDNSNGKITIQQVLRIYEVNGEVVDDELIKTVTNLADKDGMVTKMNFMVFAFSTHLCKEDPQELKEQLEKKVEKGEKFHSATASKKHQAPPKRNSDAGKLADKASIVFEKFDLNKDGYLSRDEFCELMKDVPRDQANRIFNFSASTRFGGDGRRISIEQFRALLNSTRRLIE